MKCSLFVKFCALFFLLLTSAGAFATDYYVDANTTSSTQTGASSTPWKTISQVNSKMSSFNAGDFIYLKKGSVFTGQLTITRSGTAAAPITFSSYGTGAMPIITGSSDLLNIYMKQYVVIDGINFTDVNMNPSDHSAEAVVDRGVYIDQSSYVSIKNCSFSLIGVGIYIDAANNTVDNCTFENLRMIRNTPGGDDDYGANPLVISGANNSVTHSTFRECWAMSYDYGYDGGAIEIYGSGTNNTKVMYNTAINCNGFMEIGSGDGGSSNNNIAAYNKIINCNNLVWISNSGNFAIGVSNLQFYNNVIVHTKTQFATPSALIGMQGSSSVQGMVVAKNNIFWLTQGMDVAGGQFSGGQLVHENNVYKLGSGSVLGYNTDASELITTNNLFTNTSSTDPLAWDYNPGQASPVVDFGQKISGLTVDFVGSTLGTPPNSGLLEGGGAAPSALAMTATAGTINCNGGTATVTVTATGGVAPYSGTGTFTKNAGSYTFTVTDAAGNAKSQSVTIAQPSLLSATLTAGVILTFGGTTIITTVALGGTPAYTYSLNGGTFQASNIFLSVSAGSQTITVKDARGCISTSNIVLTQPGAPTPPALVLSAASGTISCNGGNTSITLTATGGTGAYTYSLNNGAYQSSNIFSGVTAGTYSLKVKDAAGTVASKSVTISQPAALTATTDAGTITVNGGSTTITVAAGGGTPSYTYRLNSGSYQSSNVFTNVVAGTYSVTVKDANGCSTSASITVTQPSVPELLLTAASGTINCNGDRTTVTLSASGGTGAYTYSFNNSAYQSSNNFANIGAGTYTAKVKDGAGTIVSTSVTINQPTALTSTINTGTIAVNGGSTTVTVLATGGTTPYTYRINSGTYQSSNTFTNVIAGTYTLTIRDSKGCTLAKNITINQPGAIPTLVASASAAAISCNGGSTTVTVIATGGTTPYTGTGTFTKAAGAYSFVVTDGNGQKDTAFISIAQPAALSLSLAAGTIATYGGSTNITASVSGGTSGYTFRLNTGSYQSANTFTGVVAGSYTVTVKDANGCTSVKSIVVSQPAQIPTLVATATAPAIACNGGSVSVTVSATGGTSPYTGTGTFTKTAGSWSFIVTDAGGVTATALVTVAQPAAIVPTVATGTISTYGGTTTATITAVGGSGIFSYNIDNGSYQSSNIFTAVAAGSHVVKVKDANGCTAIKNFTIVQPAPPQSPTPPTVPALIASAVAGTISCNGGSTTVTVSATGGTSPYSGTGSFTKTAGTYTFVVTDANGLKNTVSVTIGQPSVLNATVATGTISVYGAGTTVTATANGGSGGYTYKLDNAAAQTSGSFTGVLAGTHSILIKDAKGCTVSKGFTLTQPDAIQPLVLTLRKNDELCRNAANGTITATANGGKGPFQYKLNDGAFAAANYFTDLRAGTYTVYVKDAMQNTSSKIVTIDQGRRICRGIKLIIMRNPAITEFELRIETENTEDIQIIVMNLNGQRVYQGRGKANDINRFGSNFANGFYIAKVIQGRNVETIKLLKGNSK